MKGVTASFSRADEHHMRAALELARRGKGTTSPNPAVGAVIVKGGQVIGRGWHHRSGERHAEVQALSRATAETRGATMYVTMEPCCTFGRTPPCTGAITAAGLRRVVIGTRDPNPQHRGRGISLLRRRGIRVDCGLLQREIAPLNEDFAKYISRGLPFTTVKAAMTLDGKIASVAGDSRWISGLSSREYSHRLRWFSDAVLVGSLTALRDDPLLTVRARGLGPKFPWRVILDSRARLPLRLKVFRSPGADRTILAVTGRAPRARLARFEALGVRVIRCRSRRGEVSLKDLWRRLAGMKIMSLLVEGGGQVISSVLEAGLADRAAFFISPRIIGGRDAPTPVDGEGIKRMRNAIPLSRVSVKRLGDDILVEGYIRNAR